MIALGLTAWEEFVHYQVRANETYSEAKRQFSVSLLLLLLLLKIVSSPRLGVSDMHPIRPRTPAPQYQPIDRKKRKGKRVEDYSRGRAG